MIIHSVLLHPKPETSVAEIHTVFGHVRALQETIPGMIDVQIGKNLSENHQGYTYGFVMQFVDSDHLKAYTPHPAHQRVSEELIRICHSIIDFDIEHKETR